MFLTTQVKLQSTKYIFLEFWTENESTKTQVKLQSTR